MSLENVPIHNEEKLYRADKEGVYVRHNKVLAGIFTSRRGGISVFRDGRNHPSYKTQDFMVKHTRKRVNSNNCDVIYVLAGDCRDVQLSPENVNNEGDHYHAEIRDADGSEIIANKLKLMQLAERCVVACEKQD